MERKGIFKLPYQILIYEIPKYMKLNDYINYTSTCKYLNNNLKSSDIWKRVFNNNNKYTEDEKKFVNDETTYYDKYKKLVTQTISYKNCDIAHRINYWTEKNDSIYLNSVCWFHIVGKLNNVPDGRYVPEFKVKIKRRPLGLDHLEFIASVVEQEIDQSTEIEQKENMKNKVEKESSNKETETQHNIEESNGENSSSSNEQVNNPNRRSSLFDPIFRIFPFNINSFSFSNSTNNNINESLKEGEKDQKKELISRVIKTTKNKFNRNTLNLYKNDEWRIIECPEITVDHSIIDQTKSKLRVELEIKDINGYWKSGISFRGMRLRKVIPSDSDTETIDSDSDME